MSTAEEALKRLVEAAEQINFWPRCEEYGMGEIHAVEGYSRGCADGDKWTIAFDVFYKQGTCFEVDWSDFKELAAALDGARQHVIQKAEG